jgi:hypothetical protein
MIYSIPIVGWLLGLFFHTMLAIPFYFLWNGLAPTYFYWLPPVYQNLGFMTIVGLFILLSILKAVLLPRFGTRVTNDLKKS